MSSSKKLLLDEYNRFTPHHRILFFLYEYQKKHHLHNHQIRILDWGCGNGKTVLWFLERGYEAFGVDVEEDIFPNARAVYISKGFDAKEHLAVLGSDNTTTYPDNHFDYIISYQVLEHVEDLGSVAKEISRVTKCSGIGYHKYPPHYYIIEGHLNMPLVHWLPKNKIRFFFIWLFVLLGIHPNWSFDNKNLASKEKAQFYYDYCAKYTHYRMPHVILKAMRQCHFDACLVSISNPKLSTKIGPLSPALRIKIVRVLLAFLINNFYDNELLLEKK